MDDQLVIEALLTKWALEGRIPRNFNGYASMKYEGEKLIELSLETEQIPKELKVFRALKTLKLKKLQLLDISLLNMLPLDHLAIRECKLSSKDCKELLGFNLKSLELVFCDIGEVEVPENPTLEILVLAGNRLRNIPKNLDNLKRLQLLDLSFNPIKEIPVLPPIPRINLWKTKLMQLGSIPDEVKLVDISGTPISASYQGSEKVITSKVDRFK